MIRLALLITSLVAANLAADEMKPNMLTPDEKAGGWKLLFDGKSLSGWRSFKKKEPPQQGWAIEESALRKLANVYGGDIISTEEFTDFELQWDWKVAPHANNGIKYFVTEDRSSAVGHEYQMIDDPNTAPKHRTASFYDVLPPSENPRQKPVKEWNHSGVIVRGNHVEHWLNGTQVLEYELGSEQLLAAVAKSKFKDVPRFGTKGKGHILLTDHKDEAWFRNVKIRSLPMP